MNFNPCCNCRRGRLALPPFARRVYRALTFASDLPACMPVCLPSWLLNAENDNLVSEFYWITRHAINTRNDVCSGCQRLDGMKIAEEFTVAHQNNFKTYAFPWKFSGIHYIDSTYRRKFCPYIVRVI